MADISTVEKALNIAPRPSIRKGTVKHCVMLALRDCRNGMDTESLMAIVSSHGLSGKKNTVTPQLSRLKRDGFLTKRGRLWVLAAHKWLEE